MCTNLCGHVFISLEQYLGVKFGFVSLLFLMATSDPLTRFKRQFDQKGCQLKLKLTHVEVISN